MSSFEQRFYLENPSRRERLWRNIKLLWVLLIAAMFWLSKGYFLRKKIKQAKAEGKPVVLEDWGD